jgi:hypothetical protein
MEDERWTVCEIPPTRESGRQDLNLRPLAPHASALAKLRHAPFVYKYINAKQVIKQILFKKKTIVFVLLGRINPLLNYNLRKVPHTISKIYKKY